MESRGMSKTVDLTQHITLHVATLKFFQLWFFIPYSKKSVKYWLAALIRVFFGLFVFVIPSAAQCMYVIRLLASGKAEIQEVAGTMNIVLTELLTALSLLDSCSSRVVLTQLTRRLVRRYLIIIINLVLTELLTSLSLLDSCLRRHILTQLTDQLVSELYYYETHKTILEKGIKLSRRLFVGLFISSSLDVAVHMVVVPTMHLFKTLPVKMDFIFFDVNDPAYFKYVCAYQIAYKPILVATFVSVRTLIWSFMCCANSQLDVLINKLENKKALVKITGVERGCDENEAYEIIFKGCMLHHSAILRFAKTMQAAFGGQLSITLFISACIIGTTGVQIISIESPRDNITEVIWVLTYLSIFIGNLFVDCYFGNALTHKSLQIPGLVFAGPWLDIPTKMKKNLVIFIAKAQQPIVLVAAKLAPVSMQTFTTAMNWTYKGFAVMNQMKK